jgi:hypothetical protein
VSKNCTIRMKLGVLILVTIVAPVAMSADFPVATPSGNDHAVAVAYNSQTHEYLVVWLQGSGTLMRPLMGQRVTEKGAVIGNPTTIEPLVFDSSGISLAYNASTNEFLVAFVSGILPDYGVFCQRLSATGVPTGTRVQPLPGATMPKVLYNTLAGNYLVLGAANDLFSARVGANGQPLGSKQNLTNDGMGIYSSYAAAYGPVVSPETPQGRYLVVKYPVAPIMLDSDGKPLSTMYQPSTGLYWPEIPFFLGNTVGGMHNVDVAFGDTTWQTASSSAFLIVWSDDNNMYQSQQWTGIWGGYVDAEKLSYTTTDVLQDYSFPISYIAKHWAYSAYSTTWKPKVAYNPPARKFQVAWRETPSTDPLNDTKVNHIRGNTGFFSKPPTSNTVLSAATGAEDPVTPVIAPSTSSAASLVVWIDSRNQATTGTDIYGAVYPIMGTISTPVGTSVSIDLGGGSSMTFSAVSIAGTTTYDPGWDSPAPPSGQKLVHLPLGGTAVEITTTATFGGTIQICLRYDDENLTGSEESQVSLRTCESGTGTWVDITSSRDTITNCVYGTITHLSGFAVMCPTGPAIVVTNTHDNGPGSLRQALADANAHAGPDSIAFAIPDGDSGYNADAGVWTIKPSTQLPPLTDGGTIIDGLSQAASVGDRNPHGPEIRVDGHLSQHHDAGLVIVSSLNRIRGLSITGFWKGIEIGGAPVGGNLITQCYVGVLPDGVTKGPNEWGVTISNSALNFIGFLDTLSANVIGGNGVGIFISDSLARFNVVGVNCIGTDLTHKVDLGNVHEGILFSRKACDNVVTGWNYPSHVVIRNNGDAGIRVTDEGSVRNLLAAGNISANGGPAIVLENGGNDEKAPPVITEAGPAVVRGTAAPHDMVFIYCDPEDEGEEYCATVYADAQGKFSWTGTSKGPHVTAVAVDTTRGETTNNTSRFSAPFTVTGTGTTGEEMPVHSELLQNYPNPFNPRTLLTYAVGDGRAVRVKIAVYDLLGREVVTLVDEERTPGKYAVAFEGSEYASGIYVVRMQAGTFTSLRKMLMIK